MSDKFLPEPQQLPPVTQLIKLTEVTKDDIDDATASWKDNPPDNEYKLIIEAEIEK